MAGADIQAGIKIKALVEGLENIDRLQQELQAAGVDTTDFAERAQELRQELEDVTKEQALIEQYQALGDELQNAGKDMAATGQRAAALDKSLQGDGGKKQQQDMAALDGSLEAAGQEMASAGQRMDELDKELQSDGGKKQQKDMAALGKEQQAVGKQSQELTGRLKTVDAGMDGAAESAKDLAGAEKKLAEDSQAAAAKLDALNDEAQELKALADARMVLGIDTDDKARSEIEKVNKAFNDLKASGTLTQEELARASDLHRKKVNELEKSLKSTKVSLSEMVGEIGNLVTKAGGIAYVTKEAMEFERAMAGVKKVVDGTPQQMEALSGQIKNLAFELGMVPEAVAEIAAQGGQLGIPLEKLGQFTEMAGKMAVAFDIGAEAAAEAAAKLTNVFDLPLEGVELLGDAINLLGNNTAAKEKDIVDAMTRIGGNAKQFGLAAEEAAALADAMIALGKPPEVAATAINALLSKLQTAQVQGDKFQEGLRAIGLSADKMAADIAADPQQALNSFLKSLENLDKQSRSIALSQMFGTEYSDDIALLVGSLNEYDKALNLVADKSKYAGAMQQEFQNAMNNASAKVQQAQIAIVNVAKELGATMLPIVSAVSDGVGGVANAVTRLAQQYPQLTQFAMYLAGARVAAMAFGAAARLMGMEGVTATTAITAGAAKTTTALGLLRTSMAAANATTSGMTIAAAAQQTAMAGSALAARGLAAALRLIAANPIGLVITAAAAALTLFADKAGSVGKQLAEMENAITEADKAFIALQDRMREGLPLKLDDVDAALAATREAADRSRDAILRLKHDIKLIEETGGDGWYKQTERGIQSLKEFLPFLDSQREKLERANQEYEKQAERLKTLQEQQRQLQEQQRADESAARFAKQQQAAVDAQQNISTASRQIITDLQSLAQSSSHITAEQIRGIETSFKNLSSSSAIAEAEEQIKRLAAASKITRQEEAELLAELKKRHQELGEVQVQTATAATGTIALTRDEVKALADAYKELGMAIPASFEGMTEADEKLIGALNNIKDKTGIATEQMREMMTNAFAKVETKDGVLAIQKFFNEWAKQQDLTDVEMQRFLEQVVKKTEAAFGRMAAKSNEVSEAFKKIGVDADAAATGISSKANQAFADWAAASAAARDAGIDDTRLIRAGFEQMMGKLESRAEFEAFKRQLQESGDVAKLTKEQLERLNKSAKDGATAAKTAYEQMGEALKEASNKADFARIAAEAQAAFEAGTISAAEYDQMMAQVKQATDEAAAKAAEMGSKAVDAHKKATIEASNYEASVKRSAAATADATKANESASGAASEGTRTITQLHQANTKLYGVTKLTKEEFIAYSKAMRGAVHDGMDWFQAQRILASRKEEFIKPIVEGRQAIDELNQAISSGTLSAMQITRAALIAGEAVGKLDQATLKTLNASIDAAKAKLVELKDEAVGVRQSLEAELAALNGNDEMGHQLEHQKKIADLQAKAQQAAANHQSEAAAEYNRAMNLQNQIYAKQKAQREKERAEAAADAKKAAQAPAPSSSSNSNSGNPLPDVDLSRLNFDGDVGKFNDTLAQMLAERDQKVVDAAGKAVIDQLTDAVARQK